MAPFHVLRRLAGVLLLAALAAAGHAAPPPEIATAAPLFPENTRAVLACRLTPEVREWMFSSFFFNPAVYRKVMTEQADKFAKATGFNPLEDVEWNVIAISDSPPSAVMVSIAKKDPGQVLAALQKDPKAAPLLKLEVVKGTSLLHFDSMEVAVGAKTFAIAPAGTLKKILERGGESPTNAKLVEEIASSAFSTAQCYVLATPSQDSLNKLAQNPDVAKFGGATLTHLRQVAGGLDAKDVALVLKFDTKDAADAAKAQIQGIVTTAKGAVQPAVAKPEVPDSASPLEHINPRVILTRVLAQTGMDALNAAEVTADAEVARVRLPKDKLPLMHAEGSTLFVALAAVAGGAYGAMQAKTSALPAAAGATGSEDERAQCQAIQQRLTAAVELYNTDKKKHAKLEEVADQLVAAQYLESKPDDPGQAPGSFGNYVTGPDGRVTCKVHGSLDAGAPTESERAAPEKASPAPGASPSPADDEDDHEGESPKSEGK